MKTSNGTDIQGKTRWVFDGSQDVQGVDGNYITTSVMKWSTARMICCYAAGMGQRIFQGDVPNAYGLVDSDRPRYMAAPRGEEEYDEKGNLIVYECANIYGCKFAGRNFTDALTAWLVNDVGFTQSLADPSLYYRDATSTHERIVLGTWVDDLIYTGGNQKTIDWFGKKLNQRWSTMSNGKVKDCKIRQADFVVGARVTQTSAGIKLDHELLADKLLKEFKM